VPSGEIVKSFPFMGRNNTRILLLPLVLHTAMQKSKAGDTPCFFSKSFKFGVAKMPSTVKDKLINYNMRDKHP